MALLQRGTLLRPVDSRWSRQQPWAIQAGGVSLPPAFSIFSDGAWRSLAAHLFWEQGVEGSNPFAPTNYQMESAMCEHLDEYSRGYRSFGGDVPGYCQGAYYHGDEPGYRCTITGELCDTDYCPLNKDKEVSQ